MDNELYFTYKFYKRNQEFINKFAYKSVKTADDVKELIETIKSGKMYNNYGTNVKSITHNFSIELDSFHSIVSEFLGKKEESLKTLIDTLDYILSYIRNEGKFTEDQLKTYSVYIEGEYNAIAETQLSFVNESFVPESDRCTNPEFIRFSRVSEYNTAAKNLINGSEVEGISFAKFNVEPFYIGKVLFTESSVDKGVVQVGSSTTISIEGGNISLHGKDLETNDMYNIKIEFDFQRPITKSKAEFDYFNSFIKTMYEDPANANHGPLEMIIKQIKISHPVGKLSEILDPIIGMYGQGFIGKESSQVSESEQDYLVIVENGNFRLQKFKKHG